MYFCISERRRGPKHRGARGSLPPYPVLSTGLKVCGTADTADHLRPQICSDLETGSCDLLSLKCNFSDQSWSVVDLPCSDRESNAPGFSWW